MIYTNTCRRFYFMQLWSNQSWHFEYPYQVITACIIGHLV